MKLQFKHQAFQAEAARAVVRAFEGQDYRDGLSYRHDMGTPLAKEQNDSLTFANSDFTDVMGFGNAPLKLQRSDIAENVRVLQLEQGLKPIDHLEGEGIHLTVEMETGTGKTYTYIKTMYELNRHYGWSKFIVVVPSVAIREGVKKSFETMADHFAAEYEGKRIESFVYDSGQLGKIDHFAANNNLHVMIINMQAFNSSFNPEKNKDGRGGNDAARIIFSRRDDFRSRRPIDVLAKTNPIIIIDEPQSVLGSNKKNATREGLKQFNPLFTLLYSATHREVMNMVYRLDAIDAYNQKLVKKIEVKGIRQVGSTATNGYVYLNEIVVRKGQNPQARLSYDTVGSTGQVRQVTKLADEGFDLYAQSGEMAEYAHNFVVTSIDGREGTVTFLNGETLHEGEALGEVTEDAMRRMQIRETIKSHLERERQLFAKGIKVLSLFFIDKVEHYRVYGADGAERGRFAEMFEEEYVRAVSELQPQLTDEAYMRYLSQQHVARTHNGYFAQDKKGKLIDTKAPKEGAKEKDEVAQAYTLIMKDKERLLSFDEPTRFIFSHSALKEGWDNPNVFQICTLKNTDNTIRKRQELGRGMRLCVNQKGERQDAATLGENGVFDVNVLTVVASESYEAFSQALQREIAEEVVSRPTAITPALFEGKMLTTSEGEKVKITSDDAQKIYFQLVHRDYIDDAGKLTPTYHDAKRDNTLDLGEKFAPMLTSIVQTLDTVFDARQINVEDGRNPKVATFDKAKFGKKEFQELWKLINVKSYYEVDFDTEELIEKSIKALDSHLHVTEIRMVVEEGSMEKIDDRAQLEAGTAMEQKLARTVALQESVGSGVKYDLVGRLVMGTGLTRKTVVSILKGVSPATFHQFKVNPEEFIRKATNIINDEKGMTVVQHISYHPTTNTYKEDIFTESTLRGKLGENAIESKKSLYDLVVVDSMGVEKNFAQDLELNDEVAVYTKLPKGFYINTPMGHHNPDWAIAFHDAEQVKHIYFVAETKGNDWQRSQLRGAEDAKLQCAARHFEAISSRNDKIVYRVVQSYASLSDLLVAER